MIGIQNGRLPLRWDGELVLSQIERLWSFMIKDIYKVAFVGKKYATAIKTIMARTMRVGGISEDVSLDDMLKTEKALASVGIGIRNLETNEMRDFRDIIQELSDKFGDLDEATQSYIAESVSATV